VAINLAAALGSAAPTVLVEVDLCAPALAGYLDRDPTRGLCTLAYAVREDPRAWPGALTDELQPLTSNAPGVSVLCGPPKREMRTSIAPSFVERLVAELAQRYRYVILDVGPDLLGMDSAAANHRAALASAQRLLVVSGSNLVGLWHTRTALEHLERQLGVQRQAVHLVLNRHDVRHHHARAEVEWHLGSPVAAVIPADYPATERAIAEQRPLVAETGTRAGRALLELAERLHEGRLRLPPQVGPRDTRSRWWRRIWPRGEPRVTRRSALQPEPIRAVQSRSRRSQVW
jgi:Flp pilus assembly CpaE family ATPase